MALREYQGHQRLLLRREARERRGRMGQVGYLRLQEVAVSQTRVGARERRERMGARG
jgi:hypothetical protein